MSVSRYDLGYYLIPEGVDMMTSVRRIAAFAAAAFFSGLSAQAADRKVQLQSPPPIAKEAAAMPLIVDPSDDAERRINAALKRLDANLRKGAHHKAGATSVACDLLRAG